MEQRIISKVVINGTNVLITKTTTDENYDNTKMEDLYDAHLWIDDGVVLKNIHNFGNYKIGDNLSESDIEKIILLNGTKLNSIQTPMLSISSILDYEVRSSWWASLVSNYYLQKLSGRYFAWKIKRKYNRYLISRNWQTEIIKNK